MICTALPNQILSVLSVMVPLSKVVCGFERLVLCPHKETYMELLLDVCKFSLGVGDGLQKLLEAMRATTFASG